MRKFVNGSCIATRLMPRMPSWSRKCERNMGSNATFFITLDSLGVTWLMIETNTGLRLCVIAVTRIDMLKSSSATWPWLSPNGPSGSSSSLSIRPSITISASAGTCRSTVAALAMRMGAPANPPATAISSRSIGSFCGPVNSTTGAQPMTMAQGIGSLRF